MRTVRKLVRKRIRLRVVFLVIFAVLMVAGGFGVTLFSDYSSLKDIEMALPRKGVKKPKEYTASLFMVGDALIHESVYYDARVNGGYDFKPMIDLIKPTIEKYDLAYYNQETILGGPSLGYSNYPRFNSPQEVGDAFIDAGFDIVSLATNHTMDKGEQGVINSVNYWKSHPEIVTSGQWTSQEERDEVKIYEKNNIKYAFFSYTTWNNGLGTPYGKSYLNNEYSDEKAKADIEKVRDKVDVVMVAMHWGTEYSMGVSADQTRIAYYLSDLGVDIIIGAHPHVVEPVEYINDGKTFVIYSLGNFISGQIGIERLSGLMMEVTIKKVVDVDDSVKVTIENPKAELTYTRYHMYGVRDFKVFPYPQLNDSILPGYQNYYNQYKGVVSSRCPELTWGLTWE